MMEKNIRDAFSTIKEKVTVAGEMVAEKGMQIKESETALKVVDSTRSSAAIVANGITASTQSIVEGVKTVSTRVAIGAKNAQVATLQYIDKKKNAKFLDAKLKSFEDGIKKGKIEAVDYIKKYTNFCLAATAVSFYFARCDGDISEEELLEIQFDLDAIMKNKDLPEELRNTLAGISIDENLSFKDVKKYLDGVSVDTVLEFQKDIDEIILADGVITEEEKAAKMLFDDYLAERLEASKNE